MKTTSKAILGFVVWILVIAALVPFADHIASFAALFIKDEQDAKILSVSSSILSLIAMVSIFRWYKESKKKENSKSKEPHH